jgi:PAS domain S-box/diguanylate cyclase (GGDEF) domain
MKWNSHICLLLIFAFLNPHSGYAYTGLIPDQIELSAQTIGATLILALVFFIYLSYQIYRLKTRLRTSLLHEDRLRTLYTAINQSPASVVIAGLDANIRYVNPRFTEVTGYSLQEVMGLNPNILHSGLTSTDVYEEMWQTLQSGQDWSGEFINRKKNGEIYWEQAHISPVFNTEGQVIQYVAVKLDITERIHRERYQKAHNRVLELLSKGAPLNEILLAIVAGVEAENPEMMCSILLLDKAGKHLLTGAAPSLPDFYNQAINGVEIGEGRGSCGTAAFTGKRVIVDDIATHPYWVPYLELATQAHLGACWSEPIYGSTNKVLGTFAIYHKEKHSPQEKDIKLIEASANLAAIAIERYLATEALRLSEEKHRLLAHYDSLTGLPTRVLFSDRLKQAIRSAKRGGKKFALMFIDLDNFKPVNDSFGHEIGDLLLKEVADRMVHCLRDSDTVCRIGGDEFVILLDDVSYAVNAVGAAEKILMSLSQPFELADTQINISGSIGIALYPDHGTDERTLTKNADAAMYQAKENGKNQIQVF